MKSCKRVVYTYFILSFKGTESFAGKGDEGYYKFLPSLLVVCAKNAPHEHHGKQHNSNRDEVRRRRTMLASSEGRVIEFISTSLCFWEKRGGGWKKLEEEERPEQGNAQAAANCYLHSILSPPLSYDHYLCVAAAADCASYARTCVSHSDGGEKGAYEGGGEATTAVLPFSRVAFASSPPPLPDALRNPRTHLRRRRRRPRIYARALARRCRPRRRGWRR